MTDAELLDVLQKIQDNKAIPVRLSQNESSLNVLKTAISNAIREAKNESAKNPTPEERQHIENTRKLNEETKKASKELEDFTKKTENATGAVEEITNEIKNNNTSVSKFGVTASQVSRALDGLNNAFWALRNTIGREVEKRVDWMKQLDDAGIRLSKGFDKSFTDLANKARLSHDQYAKFLVANTETLHKLSSTLTDSEEKISNAMGNLTGKYGLSGEQIQAGMSGYINNILKYRNGDMSQEMINTESERYIKNLKELSLATGKTVEHLEKENEIRENSLWAKRTEMDPRLSGMYKTLKSLGFDDTKIRGMMTGVPNDETMKLAIDPNMRSFMSMITRDTRMLQAGRNVDFIGNIGNELNRGRAAVNNRGINGIDYATAGALHGSVQSDTGGFTVGLFNSGFDLNAARKANESGGDTGILNRFASFFGYKNMAENNANKTLSPSMQIISWLGKIGGWLMQITGILTLMHAKQYLNFLSPYLGKGFKSFFGKLFDGSNIMGQLRDIPLVKWTKTAGVQIKKFGGWLGKLGGKFPAISKMFGKMSGFGGKILSFVGKSFVKMIGGALGGSVGADIGGWLGDFIKKPLAKIFGKIFGGNDWFNKGSLSGNILQLISKTLGGAVGGFLLGNWPGDIIGAVWGLFQGIMGWESNKEADTSRLMAQDQGINGLSQKTLDIYSGYNASQNLVYTQNDVMTGELRKISAGVTKTAQNTNALPEEYSYNRSEALAQSSFT